MGTMQRCTRCGVEKVATAEYFHRDKNRKNGLRGECKDCVRERQKKYDMVARSRKWQQDNRERHNAYQREYARTHKKTPDKEARRLYNQKRWAENKEKERERKRKWARENPAKYRQGWQRRRLTEFGAPGSYTDDDVKIIWKQQRGLCHWCGKKLSEKYEIDHRIPISRGGSHNPENLVLACAYCNRSKGSKLPHEWCGRLL